MRVTIPQAQRDHVATMLQIPVEKLEAIWAVLRSLQPAATPEDYVELLKPAVDVSSEILVSLVGLLTPWAWLRVDSGMSAEETLSEIQVASRRTGEERLAAGWENRMQVLQEMISPESPVVITAKACFLSQQVFRLLGRARVFTDARPIFSELDVTVPARFVVSHTLQLAARDQGSTKDWYFSMDLEDLRDLKLSVERAIKKQEALSSFFASTSASLLESKNV